MTAEHDKKRTAQHVDRLMARLKAAERERDEMRATLAQQDEPSAIPAGYALVPLDPTPKMWAAINKLDDEMASEGYDGRGCSIEQAWNCLIDAAPHPAPVAQIPDEATLPMLKAYGDALQAGCELDGSTVWRVMLAAARGVEPCSCDQRGIGAPGVTCGDCPRDYKQGGAA